MRDIVRRYRLIGLLILIAGIGIIFLNVFGLWRWSPRQLFSWEAMMRSRMYPIKAPDTWFYEREQLLEQVAQLKNLSEENDRLRSALNFYLKKKYAFTMANVVSRDPLSASLMYLDVGSDSGVAIGQPVIVGEGILIGKIIRVSGGNSVAELISADSSRIAVKALDDTGTSGLLRGTLGIGTRLEYIRDVGSIAVGSALVTSGLEPLIPQGLAVGTVQKIVDSPDTLFAYADVLPAADMNNLNIVSVLRGL